MQLNFLNLRETERDQHIYRIMPQEYVISLFKKRQNVLSQIHKWKDKFENFQLALGGVPNGETFEYRFKDDFVGQCWTQEYLSEAMWGIYANDPTKRYLRIRSTPRKLIAALAGAHPDATQDTCFVGKVKYLKEDELKAYAEHPDRLNISATGLAESLLLKRRAFKHECEVRLLYFGTAAERDPSGLHRYDVAPHQMITQIMADPNRDRRQWITDRTELAKETEFSGEIKRSKIYDPPAWGPVVYTSAG